MAVHGLDSITGVIPALITCFDEKGEFDERRQRNVVRFLLGRRVNGLYVTGSTGESFMMAPDERKRVVETVIDEVAGTVPVLVHVGAVSTRLSVELARHAEKCGADAVSSVPPFYWKFTNDQIFDYYRDLADSVRIPTVIYNIDLAGLMGFNLLKRLSTIAGVQGIKYTASTHHEIMRIKEEIGKGFVVYSGADEMAASGLMFGAQGVIGSFYNMIPEVFLRVYEAVQRGDARAALQAQTQANAVIFFCLDYSYLAVIKRSLAWVGVDAGFCRKPMSAFTSANDEVLRNGLRVIRDKDRISGVAVLDSL